MRFTRKLFAFCTFFFFLNFRNIVVKAFVHWTIMSEVSDGCSGFSQQTSDFRVAFAALLGNSDFPRVVERQK